MAFITPGELAILNGYVTTAEAQPWVIVATYPAGDVTAPVRADWNDVVNYIAALGVTYGFDPAVYTIDLVTGEIILI